MNMASYDDFKNGGEIVLGIKADSSDMLSDAILTVRT
jgi:hypothetical protein